MDTIKIGDKVKDYSSLAWGMREGIVTSIKGNSYGIQEGASFWITNVKWLKK